MRGLLDRRDATALLGVAAVAALATSLGVDPRLAAEVALLLAAVLLVAVLLRLAPTRRDPPDRVGDVGPTSAATRARRTVESTLADGWGVDVHLRPTVRALVAARLAARGRDAADPAVHTALPAPLRDLLADDRRRSRDGLAVHELDTVLSALEELDP